MFKRQLWIFYIFFVLFSFANKKDKSLEFKKNGGKKRVPAIMKRRTIIPIAAEIPATTPVWLFEDGVLCLLREAGEPDTAP